MQAGFKFDINKCVGCHACSIACSIENSPGHEISWREVNTFNEERINSLPHYHLSMACNHCEQPICLEQCPARAISKNEENGLVIIDENKCIGCKYCGWVCPYDAPKYNNTARIMTKCTLCDHRLEKKLKPACVAICPTDALESEYFETPDKIYNVPGFPQSAIKPAIRLIELNPNQTIPGKVEIPYSNEIIENHIKNKPALKSKIEIKNEWPLILLTFLIAILGSVFSSTIFSDEIINPISFTFSALTGIALSSLHLGKKRRSYRAVLNLRSSWLSREIIFINLFVLAACFFLFNRQYLIVGYTGIIFAFIAAYSIDKVYSVTAEIKRSRFHSAQILYILLLFSSFFNHYYELFCVLVSLKIIFYIKQNINQPRRYFYRKVMSTFRILSLLVSGMFFLNDSYIMFTYALAFLLFSELIDRIEFYLDFDIMSPVKHMEITEKNNYYD